MSHGIYGVYRAGGELATYTEADIPDGAILRAKVWGMLDSDEEATAAYIPESDWESTARARIKAHSKLAPCARDMFDALAHLNRVNREDHVRWFLTGSTDALILWATGDARALAKENRDNGKA